MSLLVQAVGLAIAVTALCTGLQGLGFADVAVQAGLFGLSVSRGRR